jgi:hypothetical protein
MRYRKSNKIQGITGICLLLFTLLLITACTGGDGDGSRGESNTYNDGGWILIDYPTNELAYNTMQSGNSLFLHGISFIGDGFTCAGAISFFYVTYCESDVVITWTNVTSDISGTGSIVESSCYAGLCSTDWRASVELLPGNNVIEVRAEDSYGNFGTRRLLVSLVNISVTPAHGATDIPLDSTVEATFHESIISVPGKGLYLEDMLGNTIDGTFLHLNDILTFTPDTALDYSTEYQAMIPAGMVTESDIITDSDYLWRFTTEYISWVDTPVNYSLLGRFAHTAIWTGTHMIVWGGYTESPSPDNFYIVSCRASGAIYDADNNFFNNIGSYDSSREGCSHHTAVWADNLMIVWGGNNRDDVPQSTGGRFDAVTRIWNKTSQDSAPVARAYHTAVWTGDEMIIWGGRDDNDMPLATGARYNPVSDTWIKISTASAPTARYGHKAVWTGNEMIVYGGRDENDAALATGARYDPLTDSWADISSVNAPTLSSGSTVLWTGTDMIVWKEYYTSSRYILATDTWVTMQQLDDPPYYGTSAVWNGTEMMVWGGEKINQTKLDVLLLYNPQKDSWRTVSTKNTPTPRYSHSAIWTGLEMIIWGGQVDHETEDKNVTTPTGGILAID